MAEGVPGISFLMRVVLHTRHTPPTEDAFRTLTAPFAAIALLVMMIHQIGDSSATVS